RCAPGPAAVEAVDELDLVVCAAGEIGALICEVQLAGARINGREWQTTAGAQEVAGVRRDVGDAAVLGDDCRPAPGATGVGRPDHLKPDERDGSCGGVGVLDRVVE